MQQANPIALDQLRAAWPDQYRLWMRALLWISLGGYAIVCATHVILEAGTPLWATRDFYAMLLCLVAVAFERRGHLVAAGWLVSATVYLEAHVTLVFEGVSGPSAPVLAMLVLGIGLLLGSRVALGAALLSVVLVPTGAFLGGVWGLGPGLAEDELSSLAVLLISVAGSGVLLRVIMGSFSRVLQRARLQESQAQEMIDYAPDAIVVLDDNNRVVEFNPTAERYLGVLRTDVLGRTLSELPLRDEQHRALDGERLLEPNGLEPESLEATQTERRLEALYRQITHTNEKRGLMMVLRDTTARRQAEERASELQVQLQHAQKLEAVGQLAGGVAHDFNNLLTTVGGYAALIGRSPDPKAREYAEELLAVQERGAALTRQLLSFARKEVVQPRLIDLAKILSGMDKLFDRLVGEQIELHLGLTGPCPIHADPGQIEQVMLNLCANARDAMPHGGHLWINCRPIGGDVMVTVEDSGQGMDEQTRERAFEPFFTTKPRGAGTGLGLSTVHGIVSDSGGHIQVHSRIGHGTCFELRWPKSAERPNDEAPRSSQRAFTSGTGWVLLAEDDEHSRRFVQQLLTQAGYQVIAAADGRGALEELKQLELPPDLLLTDVMMPGMTGVELAQAIRQLYPQVPVLFISGYLDDVLSDAPFDPVEDLLLKPFQADELLRRIGRKLRGGVGRAKLG